MSAWDVNLSLNAWQEQRAILKRGRQLYRFQPGALVVCPLSMAGEDPSLHAVMLGPLGGGGQLIASPDPRSPKSRLEMFSRLLKVLEKYVRESADQTDALPQIIVPSASAVSLLASLADWLPYLADPDSGSKMKGWAEDARRLGEYLKPYSQRSMFTGQQLVINASQMLDQQFAFGQELKGHLGAQLTWIDPPEDEEVSQAALRVSKLPSGVRTDAQFDSKVLNPAIEGWLKVEQGGSRSLASFRRKEIEDALRQTLEPVYDQVNRAAQAVAGLGLDLLPGVDELWVRDRRAVEWHLKHMDDGGRFARDDNAARAAFGLAESEDSLEQWKAALVWYDPLERARARAEGSVLHGEAGLEGERYTVATSQKWLRLRLGDELYCMTGQGKGVVEAIRRESVRSVVVLRVSGSTEHLPAVGEVSDWGCDRPDWFRLANYRGNLSRALEDPPATHLPDQDQAVVAPGLKDGDPDPLQVVEELR